MLRTLICFLIAGFARSACQVETNGILKNHI